MKTKETLIAKSCLIFNSSLVSKFVLGLASFLLLSNFVFAATYYSNNANPSSTGNWWTNTNGTGSNPSNFTTSGDIFILQSGQTCATSGDWTIGSGVTLQVDGTLSINGNNDDVIVNGIIIFTNTSATQVTMAGGGSGNTLVINGEVKTSNANGLQGTNCSIPANATKKTTTLNSAATYEFNCSSAQAISGLPATVTNLKVNNGNTLDITTSIIVSNTLTLSSGILKIAPGNTINITSGNAISGSGFGNNKHINTQVNTTTGVQGFIRIGNISSSVTIPCGDGTNYLPVTLTPSSTSDFSVNVFPGATINGTPNGVAFSNALKLKMVNAIWAINRNSGTGNVDMTLSWPNALEGATFSTFGNSSIGITHYGGVWDLPSGSGNQAANTATRTGISSFSPFGVGETGSVLPLKFGNIKLFSVNSGLQIDWKSLTEINVDHYEIERSQDGQQFNKAGQVIATGNNTSEVNYSWVDTAPFSGNSFYRIKAVDIDGKVNYSSIVKNSTSSISKKDFLLYPNPVRGSSISIGTAKIEAGQYQFSMYDISGRQMFNQSFHHGGGTISEVLPLPQNMLKGIYNIKLSGKDITLVKTLLVQ